LIGPSVPYLRARPSGAVFPPPSLGRRSGLRSQPDRRALPSAAAEDLIVAFPTATHASPEKQGEHGPIPLYQPQLLAPAAAAGSGVRPLVRAKLVIDASGKVTRVDVTAVEPSSPLDDAFRTAVATLADRSGRSGGNREPVLDWVRAQDQVFASCRGDSQAPAPAPAGSPPWLIQDRAYQTASALFYANRFDEARSAFQAIARDADSPWSAIAPYMVARTLPPEHSPPAGAG
jgi:hypothetical protein